MSSFGQIKIANPKKPGDTPLNLTFTTRKAFDEALTEFRRNSKYDIVDFQWGYAVTKSKDEAVKAADFWLR